MTGAERKRAWRARQEEMKAANSAATSADSVSTYVVDYPTACASIRKSLRTEIRLKHSLAADREIAVTMRRVDGLLTSAAHQAILPTLEGIKRNLGRPSADPVIRKLEG